MTPTTPSQVGHFSISMPNSGAILAIAPGWGAIAAYSPRLDSAGNRVRSAIAIEELW
jgi:glutaminase